MNGTVESTTTDWRGDTLTAALISSDAEILVGDTSDFDEEGGWLTIADSDPLEYLSVDEDASTVTLAATVGAAYGAGDPVVVWDPTVPPTGAKVVEYLASVMTDRGPVDAVIPHETIPLAGVDRLDGASVALTEDESGEWVVGQVFGRDPSVDQAFVGTPFITLYQPTNEPWPTGDASGTLHAISTWEIATESPGLFSYDAGTGRLTFVEGGLYLFTLAIGWAGNSSGRRIIQLDSILDGVTSAVRLISGSPPDASQFFQQIVVIYQVTAGEDFRVDAWQTTGANLDLQGSSDGRRTQWQAVRVQA